MTVARTVEDVMRRAVAQRYYGAAMPEELADDGVRALMLDYINEGFGRIWLHMTGRPTEDCPALVPCAELSEYDPLLFGALSDYATWRMLSNGNPDDQQRAQFYYARFQDASWRLTKPVGDLCYGSQDRCEVKSNIV